MSRTFLHLQINIKVKQN